MTGKTSLELKSEARTNFYGINPDSSVVECVSLTRGGILTHWHSGRWPRTYRIRNGKVAQREVERVFRLTDIVAIEALRDAAPGQTEHPEVLNLMLLASSRRQKREVFAGTEAAEAHGDG